MRTFIAIIGHHLSEAIWRFAVAQADAQRAADRERELRPQ